MDFSRTFTMKPLAQSLALEKMLLPEEGPSLADKEYAEVSELLSSETESPGGGQGGKRIKR